MHSSNGIHNSNEESMPQNPQRKIKLYACSDSRPKTNTFKSKLIWNKHNITKQKKRQDLLNPDAAVVISPDFYSGIFFLKLEISISDDDVHPRLVHLEVLLGPLLPTEKKNIYNVWIIKYATI